MSETLHTHDRCDECSEHGPLVGKLDQFMEVVKGLDRKFDRVTDGIFGSFENPGSGFIPQIQQQITGIDSRLKVLEELRKNITKLLWGAVTLAGTGFLNSIFKFVNISIGGSQ